jgi:hypothetical protein
MANEQNIRKVIEAIRDEANYFNMCSWTSTYQKNVTYSDETNFCGSPSCIGGWVESIMAFETNRSKDTELGSVSEDQKIADWIGMSKQECDELFFPSVNEIEGIDPYDATREQAIAHLEHIINTGEVDWFKIMRDN